jgi:dienelactone hydrolase
LTLHEAALRFDPQIPGIVYAALATGFLGVAGAAQLTVLPETGLIDAPFHVVLKDVLAGSRVTLSAERSDMSGRRWTAVGEYAVNADGRIDTDVLPSLDGSYEGVSPHGLWCSALPVRSSELREYLASLPTHPELGTSPQLDVAAKYRVDISARIRGELVASATASRSYGPATRAEEVSAPGGVRGIFYSPPGAASGIPIVVLAGSGGGLPLAQAALLAAHGHPTLAQGLFDYKDLPATLRSIPIETVRAGGLWLAHRTDVKRVAIMGTSRGSEGAGLAASYFPELFAAAVLYVPSHLSNGAFAPGLRELEAAWTFEGKPLPADRGETDSNNADDEMRSQEPPGFIGTPYYLKTWSDPRAAAFAGIPFERMSGPLIAIGAGADQMWPSFIGAEQIRKRLASHGKAKFGEIYIYPGAGHVIARVGTGGPLSSFVFHPVAKDFEATGGLPNDNCEGSYDAWAKVIRFLDTVGSRTSVTKAGVR